ncbi:MAG: nucleotide exchange factor GrpE, partial [Peptococcaceae bacterium]|nr:nucleotide exchange factor GrpE [Peptococcaceae bacterium]
MREQDRERVPQDSPAERLPEDNGSAAADGLEADDRQLGAPGDEERELEKAREQAEDYLKNWQRLQAEFDNYRKRTQR